MSLPSSKPSTALALRHPLNYRLQCPNCQDPVLNIHEDFAAGDLVCMSCGMVLGDRIIDTRSEWRTFSSDSGNTDDPSRVGGPSNPLLDGGQLETIISAKDGFSGMSKELGRLQGRATFKPGEKNLLNSFRTISTYCERIGLPRVIVDRAKQLFKKADEEKILKGKGTEAAIASSIYIACRESQVPRTFKEISSLTMVSKKDIGRCCKAMAPFLEMLNAPSTEDFMARFCSHLNLGMDVQKTAVFVSKQVKSIGCADGKSPISVASAGIFLVCHLFPGFTKTPKDISFVSGVSEATIRNAYKDLYPHRLRIVPPELQGQIHHLPPA